jgi:hypothetical protein
MTLEQIQTAVRSGRKVCWKNPAYQVRLHLLRDKTEQWLVTFVPNGHSVGLTKADGTLAAKEEDFHEP